MSTFRRNAKGAAASCAMAVLAACAASSNDRVMADVIYLNGKIVTVDARSSVAQAIAVKDGKFLAVGTSDEVMAQKGPATKVVDLRGRTVIPGLADSHVHGAGGGPGVDLSQVRSLTELFAKVSDAAAKAHAGDVIVSNSDWHEAQLAEQRLPTAAELEIAAPGVPVVLVRGGHSYFLNNAALAKYHIVPSTPVPAGGAIPKDAGGTLTGEITDTAKALVTLPLRPPWSIAKLQLQQQRFNAYGLTSVRIPGIGVDEYRLYQRLRDEGKATLRYSILLRPKNQAEFESTVVASGIKQGEGDEWVKLWGIKAYVDGGFEGGHMTRAYAEPLGQGGTYFGITIVPQGPFNLYMQSINRNGWRAAVHAVGDAGVDEVLQGFQKANELKDITRDGWTIEHAFVTRPDQYPLMHKLGVLLSVQDHLYLAAPVLKRYWGADRAAEVTPVKTYLDEGFLVAGGTDSPVVPISPFWAMYHFLTRDTISDGVYGPDQRVTSRNTLLRLFTINNAKLTDEADTKGSIEPGKLADFVVLSADIMTIPDADVRKLSAVATYVGGRNVYEVAP